MTIFPIYLLSILISNGFGLTVIWSMNKKTSGSKLSSVLKFLIPFYYTGIAISLIKTNNNKIENAIIKNEEKEEEKEENTLLNEYKIYDDYDKYLANVKDIHQVEFINPGKYAARRNDMSIYDNKETPLDYITRQTYTKEDENELTPFTKTEDVKEEIVENDLNKNLAKAIAGLDTKQLEQLKKELSLLIEIKNNRKLVLEKESA